MVLSAGASRDTTPMSFGANLSRTTVRMAMAVLEQRYGLSENAAFGVLRKVSQHHNVKLRVVAAEVVSPQAGRTLPATTPPPPLPFTVHGRACANRAEVLAELMRVAISHCGAERGTIQLRDQMHGGLRLEGRLGFSREFAHAFSYVSGLDTLCGHAFSEGVQVVVADVDNSPLFNEFARRTLLMNGVRSCTSTPIIDDDGEVRGIVSTHHERRDAIPTAAQLQHLQAVANQTGRWLQWYERMVLPGTVTAVHAAAAAKASVLAGSSS